ncbi:MarR family winged helix-turn-helix transcriptional regulator [Brevibacillus migulae]|uniref:MarR family winged helix-turn-helix transcriptional regulator n=1 Tax=Brevibacillus migulae TaxID=1644114 RepID=UPI00142FFBF9|nr:MarR family transcriptional regulator [Brevibacillus migulae]
MNLEDSFGFILNNSGRRITQLLNLHLQPHEITTEQFSLLRRLNEQDGISQKELAKRVGKDQTNITRILDQLERKGLAKRMPNQEDRRSFLAYVTDEGRALDDVLVPIEQEVIRQVLADLSDEDVRHVKTLLTRIEQKASSLIESLDR